ncbi:Transcription termination factor, mitochondrial/chloroplastic [Dillenia turbinata]|uniref:Transcription termination factor, mitochondrial/chloroplastic n=1 Tax=Dillenia turbinata TaxID=194707 RepID=A0AAN8ZH27_9MAGN
MSTVFFFIWSSKFVGDENERAASRERVYKLWRGIGIVPDELDGLELPVTVEVMEESVEFLPNLGLMSEVINNYPLVLGCCAKKNMIPVLDYLGKLGVRMRVGWVIKPFVDYLDSLGIPRLTVARLIEQRPHILGFELQEQMKPNIESPLEFNVRDASLGPVVAQYLEIIGLHLKPKLQNQLSFLSSSIELDPIDLGRVVEKMPQVVSLSNAALLRQVDFLLDYEKFSERMNYDFMDLEEMETDSSFDITLMESRSDESSSDYEEDSDDEYE